MKTMPLVYWKRKSEAKSGDSISGYCREEDVPYYGEVQSEDLPTEIEKSISNDGTIRVVSPPIIGGRYAYRYHLYLTAERIAKLPEESDYSIENMLWVTKAEAPCKGTTNENWWWYAKDSFSSLGYSQKTPIRLMTKWKRAMLEILLETHPQREQKLAAWDHKVAAHKGEVARRSALKTPAHKKQHDQLVVFPRPQHFNGGIKQVFRYHVEDQGFSRRAKHSVRIRGTRYTTPHGSAMSFLRGTAPDDNLSLAIRAVLPMLAWSEAALGSAHAIIKARNAFEQLSRDLMGELQASLDQVDEHDRPKVHPFDRSAALSALKDFRPSLDFDDMLVREAAERQRIDALFADAIALLTPVEVEEAEEI